MTGNLTNPTCEVKVNGTAIATQNIMDILIHLGCTREINSFDVVVNNSNPDYHEGDYSPGGDKEFTKGDAVTIKIKRGTITANTNYLITGELESLEYTDQKEEYKYQDVVILRGRCLGYQLYDRKFNGNLVTTIQADNYRSYRRVTGDDGIDAEAAIAYLIDEYTSLSHIRVTDDMASNSVSGQKNVVVDDGSLFTVNRLVKIYDDNAWEYNKIASIASNTLTMASNLINSYTTAANGAVGLDLIYCSETNFLKLDYIHETIFDIIKYIADTTSSLAGEIGFNARIEYDGKFSFLPLDVGAANLEDYTLEAEAQLEIYIDDATRIRNKIKVLGKADKPYPLGTDGYSWTDIWSESVTSDVAEVTTSVSIGQNYVRCAAGAETHFETDDIVTLIDINNWGELFTVTKVVSSPTNSLLTGDASSGQKIVNVTDGTQFSEGDVVTISDDTPLTEDNVIASISSNELTMETNLSNTYTTAQNAVVTQIDDVVYLDDDTTKAYTTTDHAILAQVWTNGGWAYTPNLAWDRFVVGYESTSPIYEGSKSIEITMNDAMAYASILMILPSALNMNDYKKIISKFYFTTTAPTYVRTLLYSGTCDLSTEYAYSSLINISKADDWIDVNIEGGKENENNWNVGASFDWEDVRVIRFIIQYAASDTYTIHIDRFFTVGKRWGGGSDNSAVDGFAEDTTSQGIYGIKEHVVINDNLLTDTDCEAKAQALLTFFKNPRTTIELETKTLDIGDYPIIPGNEVAVDLTPLGISGNYRIDTCDIRCLSLDNSLTFNFVLDTTPPKLSDYLYNLNRRVGSKERDYKTIR